MEKIVYSANDPIISLSNKRSISCDWLEPYIDEYLLSCMYIPEIVIVPEVEAVIADRIVDFIQLFRDRLADSNADITGNEIAGVASWIYFWGLEMAWCYSNNVLDEAMLVQDMSAFRTPSELHDRINPNSFNDLMDRMLCWLFNHPGYTDKHNMDILTPIADGLLTTFRISFSKILPKFMDISIKDSYSESGIISAGMISFNLLYDAHMFGYFTSIKEIPTIPELMGSSESISVEVFNRLQNMMYNNQFDQKTMMYPFTWCAYAGIGSVILWNEDWNRLKQNGIVESLSEKYGFQGIDTYVKELMNNKDNNKQLTINQLLQNIANSSVIALNLSQSDKYQEQLIQCLSAMYYFGVYYACDLLKL